MNRCDRDAWNIEHRTIPKRAAGGAIRRPTAKLCLQVTSSPEGIGGTSYWKCQQQKYDRQGDCPTPT
jgi:hypothetical protein